jgi:D-ribose pyranose/furanose isomerase RbsD
MLTPNEFVAQIAPYLAGELTGDQLARFEAHLASSPAAEAELAEYQATWLALEQLTVPSPSPLVRERFRAMLAGYQQGLTSRPAPWWQRLLGPAGEWAPTWARVAWGAGLLVVGLWAGTQWRPGQPQAEAQIAQLTIEVQQMREMVMLTLLEKSSATERLRAVSLASEMPQPNPKVVEALLETLQNDSNVNVRIAAVETLLQFADQPPAREGLIRALGQQESPLVQVALIDAIVSLRAAQAVPQLQKLLKDRNTNELVRDKVKSGLDILI